MKIFSLMFTLFLISSCSGLQAGKNIPLSERIIGVNKGNIAPNIDLDDQFGFNRQLKDMKGKMVLVDFWASWCGPCRSQNPLIVGAYKRYKNRPFKNGNGFELFSVSLDSDKGRWIRAIEKDELDWPNHVSELDGMNSYVVPLYELQSLPASWLIDGDGVILSKKVEIHNLDKILNKYVID